MFNIPEKYKVNKKIPLKDLLSKEFKPNERQKLRDIIKKATLRYQISNEDIPSLVNELYRYQIIQFYDFEIKDIKKAKYVAKKYQELIKSPCVIRLFDSDNEIFSFALKRLNQLNSGEIIVTDLLITEAYKLALPDYNKKRFIETLYYENIINKENKLNYYQEVYVKAYILTNINLYSKATDFINSPIWYDSNKVLRLYSLFKRIAEEYENLNKTSINVEKMKINQNIRKSIEELDNLQYGGIRNE